jgi:hypothetical protein
MNDAYIKQLIRQEIQADKHNSQYGVNRTPVHTHNGMDAPRIDYTALNNRQIQITTHIPSTAAATDSNYGHFFTNSLYPFSTLNGGMSVINMTEVHGRAGNDAGDVTLYLVLLDVGDASLSGGVAVAGWNLKESANVPRPRFLIQGKPPTIVYPGQRLALQTTGTLTNVADVLVTVLLQY